TLAAQQARTFQKLSGDRLLLNVVTGGSDAEQRRFGDYLDHDERYDRTAEFLQVMRGAWAGSFDFAGRHYRVEGATVGDAPVPAPPIFFGGAPPAGETAAAPPPAPRAVRGGRPAGAPPCRRRGSSSAGGRWRPRPSPPATPTPG